MRVWFLETGALVMDRSQVLWNAPGGKPVEIPTFAVLIEHSGRLLLADTGMDIEHAVEALSFMQPEQAPEQTIVAQLALCGFEPADVTRVVNSHLHFDHAGGNKHFPEAEIVVHERELAQARACAQFERLAYSDRSWDHERARLRPVSGDHELSNELQLFETPGHSAGHCSLLVRSSTGSPPMLLGFDVAYTHRALERELQPALHVDPVAGQKSITRLKSVAAEHDATICLGHDIDAWRKLRHAPDFYEF